jgi:anti-sigma regulatory factor (Ser/Thr protein kinase)
MHVSLPGRAYLNDIERFLRLVTPDGSNDLTFELRPSLFSIHPVVICMIAAMGASARQNGGTVELIGGETVNASSRYLERMGLFDHLGVKTPISVNPHEPAGRFVTLSQIQTNPELNNFVTDVGPLLHASPEDTKSIKYVLFELVRNVLEHSKSATGAFVCAQVTSKGRLLIGVADGGRGVKSAMDFFHPTDSHQSAIDLAFRPGITGTTPSFGGNETNGGAGLFFMKSMAVRARTHMVMVTGDTLMKLLTSPSMAINARLDQDRITWRQFDPGFIGTAVGIDLQVTGSEFEDLLADIRRAYGFNIKQKKTSRYKARFRR